MAYVDPSESARRERKLGVVIGGIALAFMLGVPFIGWIAALFATWWMCVRAFINSPRRLADISLVLLGLLVYIVVVALTAGKLDEHFGRMWFAATVWSAFWVWGANKRFALLH